MCRTSNLFSRPEVLLSLLAASVPGIAIGQTAAFSSHTLSPDPVWSAMGGARAATTQAVTAGIGNPASAALLDRASVSGSHLVWAEDLAREWAVLATPLGSRVGLTVDAGLLHGPELMGYDIDGQSTGAFRVSEWNAGAAVGVRLASSLSAGLGARFFRLEDPADPLTGVGVSAGLRLGDEMRAIGFSATDLGPAVESTAGEAFSLPTAYRCGGEYTIGFATAAAGVEMRDGQTRASFGTQVRPRDWFALLGGVGTSRDGELAWSTGVEVVHDGMRFAYAMQPAGSLGATHQLGVTLPLRRESAPFNAGDAPSAP